MGTVWNDGSKHASHNNDDLRERWVMRRNEPDIRERLDHVFRCAVCGMPKVHHRLRGYVCPNEEHNRR